MNVLFAWTAVDAAEATPVESNGDRAVRVFARNSDGQRGLAGPPGGLARGTGYVSIGNQAAVVRSLNRYSDAMALTDVETYQRFPTALWTLPRCSRRGRGSRRAFSGRLLIRYLPGDAGEGRVELIEAQPPDVPLAATAKPMKLLPTP